jgi:hypothetical protein
VVRIALKGIAWLVGIGVLGIAAWFGVNQTDEPLSEDAQAALRVPAPPATETNGYIDFLALRAPADAPTYATGLKQLAAYRNQSNSRIADDLPELKRDFRLLRCHKEVFACVATPDAQAYLRAVTDRQQVFLQRYRKMREKAEFVDLQDLGGPADLIPGWQDVMYGNRLAILSAALQFDTGDRAEAIAELESEFAFYRRMAAGSRTLISKMIAVAMIDRSAVFAAEIARRMPLGEKALWGRLTLVMRPPTREELDATSAVDLEFADAVEWIGTRRYVRLPESYFEALKTSEDVKDRPWWEPVAPWFYRPHYSANLYVAKFKIMRAVAELPSTEFLKAVAARRGRAEALEPRGWKRIVFSPAGSDHELLRYYDVSDYFGRMHAHAGFQALVRLQVLLRAAGIRKPAEVTEALDATLGRAAPDPFTGNPMRFDAAKMTIGFEFAPKYLSSGAREFADAKGRVEMPL